MFRHIAHTSTSLTLAAIGSIVLSAGLNPAQAQENARHYMAAIPFAFGIDDAVFPAGTYQITPLSPLALRLDLAGGTRSGYLNVFPGNDASSMQTGALRFTQYGSHYFLREFSAPEKGEGPHAVSRCVPSTNEKRTAKEWMQQAHSHASPGVEVAVNPVDQH
ncbi:MAG: hypothetical protein ACJ71S_11280 [Acidobacteriaceae bacterium]